MSSSLSSHAIRRVSQGKLDSRFIARTFGVESSAKRNKARKKCDKPIEPKPVGVPELPRPRSPEEHKTEPAPSQQPAVAKTPVVHGDEPASRPRASQLAPISFD